MFTRIFATEALVIGGLAALAGMALGTVVGLVKKEGGAAFWRGLEAAVLAILGGLISRCFISILLGTGGDGRGAGLAVGWGFFLWPGGIDTIIALFGGGPVLTTQTCLLGLASIVGSFTGLMDGVGRIRRWKGTGALTFVADITWGLAGSTNGCLFHLFNNFWAGYQDETETSPDYRPGAHRYSSGFRFKTDFAVTQGAVMSNMGTNGPGSTLHNHESIHVLQNRIFGPVFTLGYLGWMAILLVPALIAGLVSRDPDVTVSETILWWCYYDNPWEVWAYTAANPTDRQHSKGLLCWSVAAAVVFAVPFYLPVLFGLVVAVGHGFGESGIIRHLHCSSPSAGRAVPLPRR